MLSSTISTSEITPGTGRSPYHGAHNFGLKVGMVGTVRFEARIQELVETIPDLAGIGGTDALVRRALREQIVILHRRLLAIVRNDDQRLMTTPGVGAGSKEGG